MRTLLALLAAVLLYAAFWQVRHCPTNGGWCHCSQPTYPYTLAAAIVCGLLAAMPRRHPKEATA